VGGGWPIETGSPSMLLSVAQRLRPPSQQISGGFIVQTSPRGPTTLASSSMQAKPLKLSAKHFHRKGDLNHCQ
jgi:hypothetical protein